MIALFVLICFCLMPLFVYASLKILKDISKKNNFSDNQCKVMAYGFAPLVYQIGVNLYLIQNIGSIGTWKTFIQSFLQMSVILGAYSILAIIAAIILATKKQDKYHNEILYGVFIAFIVTVGAFMTLG